MRVGRGRRRWRSGGRRDSDLWDGREGNGERDFRGCE